LNTEEKNPVAVVGCVRVPPGVLASSRVGVSGAAIEFESLLGRVCDCARRCLMLSMDDKGLVGDCFVVGLEKRENVGLEGSVGVGGVTRVVGVSGRPGGVSGSDELVLILPLRGVSFGGPACSSLGRTAAEGGVSGAVTVSADGWTAETAETESAGFACTEDDSCGCSVTGSCEVTLLLLLRGLNSPPIPPRTFDSDPTPDAVDSLDFLRLRANPALSLSAGDGLALRMRLRLAEPFVEGEVLSNGSTICGSDDVELFVERLVVESPATTCVISGADSLCVD
jgi:hypothetical protein